MRIFTSLSIYFKNTKIYCLGSENGNCGWKKAPLEPIDSIGREYIPCLLNKDTHCGMLHCGPGRSSNSPATDILNSSEVTVYGHICRQVIFDAGKKNCFAINYLADG